MLYRYLKIAAEVLFIVSLLGVFAYKTGLFSAESIKPNINWEAEFSESFYINITDLRSIGKALKETKTNKFLVIKDNKLFFEWYSQEFNVNKPHYTASLAKAIVGSLALLLVLQDNLLSLDDYAYEFIPHWKDDSLKSKIKIKHLATHTSGIKDARSSERIFKEDLPGWESEYWKEPDKRFHLALFEAPVMFEPGSKLDYSNPGINCLSYIISKVLKETDQPDLKKLLKERIMEPLDIPESDWEKSYGTNYEYDDLLLYEIGGGGMFTVRAVAKIVQLFVDYGKINDLVIIDSTSVNKAITFTNETIPIHHKEVPLPGLGWWTNNNKTWKNLPEDAFVGMGAGHQIVLGVPSINLVVIRFGETLNNKKWNDYIFNGYTEGIWSDMAKYIFDPVMTYIE